MVLDGVKILLWLFPYINIKKTEIMILKYILKSILVFSPIAVISQNVGIGTVLPSANLHVKTAGEYNMRLEDNVAGNASDYYITSADGIGTFQKTRSEYFRAAQLAVLPATGISIGDTPTATWTATPVKILVPRGKWAIIGTFIMKCSPSAGYLTDNNTSMMVLATLADDATLSTAVPTPDILKNDGVSSAGQGALEGIIHSPVPFNMMNGTIVLTNPTLVPKTYTVLVRVASKNTDTTVTCNITNFGSASDTENLLFAVPN